MQLTKQVLKKASKYTLQFTIDGRALAKIIKNPIKLKRKVQCGLKVL